MTCSLNGGLFSLPPTEMVPVCRVRRGDASKFCDSAGGEHAKTYCQTHRHGSSVPVRLAGRTGKLCEVESRTAWGRPQDSLWIVMQGEWVTAMFLPGGRIHSWAGRFAAGDVLSIRLVDLVVGWPLLAEIHDSDGNECSFYIRPNSFYGEG